MNDFVILPKKYYDGENCIPFLRRVCDVSDFAILQGANVKLESNWSSYERRLKPIVYTSSNTLLGDVLCKESNFDNDSSNDSRCRFLSIQPAMRIQGKLPDGAKELRRDDEDGSIIVSFGKYPQTALSQEEEIELEKNFVNEKLVKTGNKYTSDSAKYDEYSEFKAKEYEEYEYNGNQYIRVQIDAYYDGEEICLNSGRKVKNGDIVWVNVEPVIWKIDSKSRMMVSQKALASGIQFENSGQYFKANFRNSLY